MATTETAETARATRRTRPPRTPPRSTRPRRRFTADEYHRMVEAGILREDERVELLDGEIVQMSPIGNRHIESVNRCTEAFAGLVVTRRARISIQNSVRLGPRDEPQPDFALVRPEVVGAPRLGQTLLAIEVADSSLADDRRVKVPLYARSGIPEMWLLNVLKGELEVFREPRPDGYARTFTLLPGGEVACEAFPDLVLRVADLLPPPGMKRMGDKS